MFGPSFKAAKCKTQLKLCVSRVRLLRNKREMTVKQMKKEIAELLKEGKEPSATIRVEHILREEATMAAYDVIELFCELLCVRLPIIEANKECPYDLKEAISSIIFAAPRCADLPELQQLRILFSAKYGKEFAAAAAELRPDSGVNRRIIEKLAIRPPSGEVKLQMLKDIAAEHHFEWDSSNSEQILKEPKQDLLDGPLSGPPSHTTPQVHPTQAPPPQATAPQVLSPQPKLAREESSIPLHLVPGAHDDPEKEHLRPPPSPDTPPYAVNHPIFHEPSTGLSYTLPRAQPVGGSPLGAVPIRTPSVDDEELFAPAKLEPVEPGYSTGGARRPPGGREEYADVAAAAAAAAESADRAAAAARAAARLAGGHMGGRERQNIRGEGTGNEVDYQEGEKAKEREQQNMAGRRPEYDVQFQEGERFKGDVSQGNEYIGGGEYKQVYKGEKQGKGHEESGGDQYKSQAKSEDQYTGDGQYRSENQNRGKNMYKSESQYSGEGSGGNLVKFGSENEDVFSEPRSESGDWGKDTDKGRLKSGPKPVRRYDESGYGDDPQGGFPFAEDGGRFAPVVGGASRRGDEFAEQAPPEEKPGSKYVAQDSFARRLEEFESHAGPGVEEAESEDEQTGYDDEDLDLPGPPKHDPARLNSFKGAQGPFDEGPDPPRPEKGSYIPAGNGGFIFFHDEKRNLKLDEVPPADTFERPRTPLPPPPGHPDRDKVLKSTTPKRGNSPMEEPQKAPPTFDDPFELPSAPPASEMDDLTARFEALKSMH